MKAMMAQRVAPAAKATKIMKASAMKTAATKSLSRCRMQP